MNKLKFENLKYVVGGRPVPCYTIFKYIDSTGQEKYVAPDISFGNFRFIPTTDFNGICDGIEYPEAVLKAHDLSISIISCSTHQEAIDKCNLEGPEMAENIEDFRLKTMFTVNSTGLQINVN